MMTFNFGSEYIKYYHDRKKGNLQRKPISRPFRWCNALQQMIHEAHLPRGKLIKISPEFIGALITALKFV